MLAAVFEAAASYQGSGALRVLSLPNEAAAGFVLEVAPGHSALRAATAADHRQAGGDPLYVEAFCRFGDNLVR